MPVAGARHAFGQRTFVGCLATESRGATFAELTDVSVGAGALICGKGEGGAGEGEGKIKGSEF